MYYNWAVDYDSVLLNKEYENPFTATFKEREEDGKLVTDYEYNSFIYITEDILVPVLLKPEFHWNEVFDFIFSTDKEKVAFIYNFSSSKKIEQIMEQGQSYGSLTNQEIKELLKEIPICAFAKQFYCLSKSVETMIKEQQTSFYVTHLIQAIQETCLHLYEEGYSLEEIHHHVEGSIGAVSPAIKRFECITRKYDFRSILKQEVENRNVDAENKRSPRNNNLRDLIKILLIRELLGRPHNHFPPSPPHHPRPPMRPPIMPRNYQPFYDIYEY